LFSRNSGRKTATHFLLELAARLRLSLSASPHGAHW